MDPSLSPRSLNNTMAVTPVHLNKPGFPRAKDCMDFTYKKSLFVPSK